MLEWHEYMEQLLQIESAFDGISFSFGEEQKITGIPPIIKSSILMLDKMTEHQGKYNIIVFPERVQSIFIFTLMKLLHNIAEDKITKSYDPTTFQHGEKLKLGNAVVEFLGFEKKDGKPFMSIKLSEELIYSAPFELFPHFQRTDTKRRLSKYSQFIEAKKKLKKPVACVSPDEKQLALLADYKTHMDSSIFTMTSIINTRKAIESFRLFGRKPGEILLIGQTDYEGSVRSIGAGQMAGTPSIVLAPDMYAISAAADCGHAIQSIIVDASDSNRVLSQMSALDELMRLGVPITCVTDIVNSFDLNPFELRGFNIWRWDESSITENLYDATLLSSDRKMKHCATRIVEYLEVVGPEISGAVKGLSSHRNQSKEQSVQMMKLFDTLNSLAFAALRETIPFNSGEIHQARTALNECQQILFGEQPYLSPEVIEDYRSVILNLDKVYSSGHQLLKQTALAEEIKKEKYADLCIVVPERADKRRVQSYWQNWCRQEGLCTTIHVLFPAEYYPASCTQFSATVVVGWLNRAIMRKILYSFNTQKYVVLLYDCEQRWKNFHSAKWASVLKKSTNENVIKKSFSNGTLSISTRRFEDVAVPEAAEIPATDELKEIELTLRENKYRQYVARGGDRPANETVEAIPVNYAGGYLAFYRTAHKVISATKIITQDAEKIDTVPANQLQVGDFVVVREADRDLIREMADKMLENSGKSGLREIATKWKEALEIEQLFSTPEEIHQRLQDAGSTIGFHTVRRWLTDEDMIAPQQKQDLQYIAAITDNGVMNELLDQIFDAAQEVKAAHVQAGRALSMQLRSRIVEALETYGEIDVFNIWEPIDMAVEGIGTVKILKIIDVSSPIIVDFADTNRLIEE